MSSYGRESLRKWLRPLATAVALAALLAAVSAGIISGFSSSRQDVLRRTPTPPPPTRTPTIPNTPTDTLTPTDTRTPTNTPTPFATKDPDGLSDTVIIGGSTGSGFLEPCCVSYVPLFDGGFDSSLGGAGHVVLPGAITHLSVRLDSSLSPGDAYTFSLVVKGEKTNVSCTIPAKGKGDFCEAGDKFNCAEVTDQAAIAIQAAPKFKSPGGSQAGDGGGQVRMSWVAKLDLYGTCNNRCQGELACFLAQGLIGAKACNGPQACFNKTGDVGNGSCNGIFACIGMSASIGDNSCNNFFNCVGTTGSVGDGSCNGTNACTGTSGSVGNGSCNGNQACLNNPGTIGDGQCNADLSC